MPSGPPQKCTTNRESPHVLDLKCYRCPDRAPAPDGLDTRHLTLDTSLLHDNGHQKDFQEVYLR